jgi:hypothetical protein
VLICQRIVRKDLDDSLTAERYRNNILDVFINQFHDDGSGVFSTRRSYSTGDSSLILISSLQERRIIIFRFVIQNSFQGTCPHN